jgi:hypothetical protein
MLRFHLSCIVAAAALVSSASAQESKPIRLWLSPAKPPTPALRYQLLPDARVAISGDAAPLYKQAIEVLNKKLNREQEDAVVSWYLLPLDRFPKDDVSKFLADFEDLFALLDQAARHDYCNWGLRERVLEMGLLTPLPELQRLRSAGRLVALRTRLEVATGRFDKAVVTLRTNLALCRHTGETEAIIHYLVGNSMVVDSFQQLDAFVGAANAPNLYYALTDMPAPLISFRPACGGERLCLYGSFPGLAEAAMNRDAGNLSEKQLQDSMKMFDSLRRDFGLSERLLYYPEHLLLAQNIQKKHEVAKKALIAAGRPSDKVEAMPPVQVALLHAQLEYDAAIDEALRCQGLPYWEMADRLKRLGRQYQTEPREMLLPLETRERLAREQDPDAPAIPLVPFLFPRMNRMVLVRARTDRKIALLRIVEAVRCYAATHDGQLPPTLNTIIEMPLPLDPVTGRAFRYYVNRDTATLHAPPPAHETPNSGNSVTYELRIRK